MAWKIENIRKTEDGYEVTAIDVNEVGKITKRYLERYVREPSSSEAENAILSKLIGSEL